MQVESFGIRRTWPLSEQQQHFDLSHVLNSAAAHVVDPETAGRVGLYHAGLWECRLEDSSLVWSGGVYDLFGLARGMSVTREQAVCHFLEDSRVALERVRLSAIHKLHGFTLDVEIRAAAVGEVRRLRLIAAPVCEAGVATRLRGLKILLA